MNTINPKFFLQLLIPAAFLAVSCAGGGSAPTAGPSTLTAFPSAGSSGPATSLIGTSKHTDVATARARLHPMNQSGVKGVINFTDDGTTLTVIGTATGLSGGERSLVYDNGSLPGGKPRDSNNFPGACEPVLGGLGFAKMNIGLWPAPVGGVSTLGPISKTGGSYVSLDQFRTVSIRLGRGAANVNAK